MARWRVRWVVAALALPALVALASFQHQYRIPLAFAATLGECFSFSEEERTECYEERVPELFPQLSLQDIYAVVTLLQDYDPAAYYCHVIAHEIAERIVEGDPSAWTEYVWQGPENDQCSYGFFHGLQISAFRGRMPTESEIERLIPVFSTVCTTPPELAHPYRELGRRVACHHGLGHMLYYIADANVQNALKLCDRVVREDDSLPFVQGRARCYEGVTMQHFYKQEPEDFAEDRTEWTTETAWPYCETMASERHRAACVRGIRFLMLDRIERGEGFEEVCGVQPNEEERRLCYGQMMSALTIRTTHDPEALVRACAGMPGEFQRICMGHAAVTIIGNRGGTSGVDDARRLCRAARNSQDMRWCYESIAHHASFYFEPYTRERARYCRYLPAEYRELCNSSARTPL